MPENQPTLHLTPNSTLTSAINSWEAYLADKGRSPNTIKAFLSDVRLLTSFLPDDVTLSRITTKDLNRYFEWMENEREVPCSPKTLARRITATKSLFRWLHQYGVLVVDPAEKVAQRSAISPLPMVLTPDEYDAVLLAADRHRRGAKPDARSYTLVYLLLTTGIKKSETLGLKLEHVDLETPNGPQIFIRYASPANRYKERKLNLPDDWVTAYNEYLSQYHPTEQVFPWSPRRLEYWLQDVSQAAQLKKQISFDMCRWTCAVRDTRAGLDETHLRQKLGLSKIQWREISMKLQKLTKPGL